MLLQYSMTNCRHAQIRIDAAIKKYNYLVANVTPSTDLVAATREMLEVFKETKLALEPNQ